MEALLFSQHPDETTILTVILQQAGFTVRALHSFDQALEAWPERPADFMLVSLNTAESGISKQIEQLRMFSLIPICVISEPLSEDHQVALLEAGIDLLVIRPYGVRFLLAQIKSLLRRSAGVPFFSLPVLSQQGITLDPSARTVLVEGGEAKRLTQLEFRLLYTLMTHPGQIIPVENIVELVWGYTGEGNRELVRGLVQRLRSKVEPDPKTPRYILTEPGIGYLLSRPETS